MPVNQSIYHTLLWIEATNANITTKLSEMPYFQNCNLIYEHSFIARESSSDLESNT